MRGFFVTGRVKLLLLLSLLKMKWKTNMQMENNQTVNFANGWSKQPAQGNALFPLMDCPNLHIYDREQVKKYDTELPHLHIKAITVLMRRWLVRSTLCCS